MTKQAGSVSVETLKEALETLDWSKVQPILDAAGGTTADPKAIAEAVRRAGKLVFPYPTSLEKKRDALLTVLESYLAAGQPPGSSPSAIRDAVETLRVAEAGYRKLVGELSKTAASQLEPSVHVSAAIRRAEGELEHLFAEFHRQAAQQDGLTLHFALKDESGTPVDMDSALENFVGFVSMTLQMEAFKGKWFDADETIVVPALPEVTDEVVYQAGSTLFLAVLWRRWRLTEEKARVLGRRLRLLKDEERPQDVPPEVKAIIVDEGDDASDWVHRVALERVSDKMSQNLLEIGASVNIPRRGPGMLSVLDVRPLPPHDWVSNDEVHGVWGLTQYLAYDVVEDKECPGGLRLVEWVRGYSALMSLARGAKSSDLFRTKSGWQHYLAGFGLSAAKSEVLIARLTFNRSSRDLFDQPFIKLADGRYRLFALALRSISIPIVVLSTLSNLGVQLRRKGKAFEETVRETFESAGLKTYAFKEKRGDEEYEYDAVIPWGDYLFVIECKNRSNPFGSPVQMHYFDLETKDNIRQVQRLMQGLHDHPDILAKQLPPDAASKTRVPVLLNCFPYAAPGPIDGVYLYDYSAISRFFASGEIKLKASRPGEQVRELGTGKRLWAGDKPSPEDLLAQLACPSQFETVVESLRLDPRGFPLPPDWWVFGKSFVREESTELADARGRVVNSGG